MIKDIAKFLKVTGLTIYRWASGKKVPVFKVSGSWRLSRVDIETWIKR
jgi:excisionase family DNA binding protein